jgi:hypothetical protein
MLSDKHLREQKTDWWSVGVAEQRSVGISLVPRGVGVSISKLALGFSGETR